MSDHHDPVVLRRMLALRQFPMLGSVDLGELAMLAENVTEATFAPGAPVAIGGARLPAIQLIVDGRLEAAARAWGPHHVFGALEVFAARAPSTTAIAVVETHTLQVLASDLGELLEDNFGVLVAVLREVAGRLVGTDASPSPGASLRFLAQAAPGASVTESLGLVERLILLRQQFPFTRARLQALAKLAQTADEVVWPAGAVVARAGELGTSTTFVIDGTLRAGGVELGGAIGLLETLAGRPHATTIEATTPVHALASSGAALLDVLEDHPDLGLDMLGSLSRALLEGEPDRHN